jgi:hypothetical protein
MCILYYISLSFSWNEKCSRQTLYGNQNTLSVLITVLVFENIAVYDVMWKNIKYPDRRQTAIYGVWALHAGYQKNKCTHCFFTITTVTRSRLYFTVYIHCLSRSNMFVFLSFVLLYLLNKCAPVLHWQRQTFLLHFCASAVCMLFSSCPQNEPAVSVHLCEAGVAAV